VCVVTQKKVPVRVNEGEVAIDSRIGPSTDERTNERERERMEAWCGVSTDERSYGVG